MKKQNYRYITRLLFSCLATMLILLSACKKDEENVPVVTEIRNYAASPDDTIVRTVNPGQWVILLGSHLRGVTQVYFGSIPATVNNTLFSDKSIVVQIPSIPFQSVPADKLNEITVVNEAGMATFKIDIIGEPQISHIRNYADSPDDTIVNAIMSGQQINIVGYNLGNATEIAFQGVPADLNQITYTDTSTIVQVPADLSGSDVAMVNMVNYTTTIGTGSFSIRIIGPPAITSVSYEIPNEGDSVYLYGYNFVNIQALTFAGETISSFDVSADGSLLGFVAPALSQSGPVMITTLSGAFTTAYNVNDILTGIISDFEWGDHFHWDWWGGAGLTSGNADFSGNSGQYLTLKTNILDSGGGDEFSTAIRMSGVQWLSAENLADPVNRWVLKFEVSIPDPWNGGTLCIKSSNGSYMARYEPWQVSSSKTAAYSTKGWQTISIPLSSFRLNDAELGDGKGTPIESITELVGTTGISDMILYLHNYGSSATKTGFNGAFDNFRIVKR